MALFQSGWATRQRNTPNAGCAGAVVAQVFEYTLGSTALTVGDIIELAVLPGTNTVVDAILVSEAVDGGTLAADIGIMSGEVGDKDSVRTCGDELFAAQEIGEDVVRASAASAFAIEPAPVDRSIGVKVTTAPTAQVAGTKIRLLLKYAAV